MLSNPLPSLARPISTTSDALRTPTVGSNSKASVRLKIVGGRADAERQRNDRRQRENRAAPQQTDGVPEVGGKGHGSLDSNP